MAERDYAAELGCLGFTMRLKRISDALMHDGKKMYKKLGLDIEPNWYVVFRLLKMEGAQSVMEIAEKIKLSHPSVIALTSKMTKAGYLKSATCEHDSRKRLISLTDKALEKFPTFEQVWEAGEKTIIEVLEGTGMMTALCTVEKRFNEKGFKDRTIDHITPS